MEPQGWVWEGVTCKLPKTIVIRAKSIVVGIIVRNGDTPDAL
jgi:hypothetical protein